MSLFGKAFSLGTSALGVLLTHLWTFWYRRLTKKNSAAEADLAALYCIAFKFAKAFMNGATLNTIEDMQSFFNIPTPSPSGTQVDNALVPWSCCDEAAGYLLEALVGEDVARRLVGGVEWWQVRNINGIDARWIAMKKDRQRERDRHETQQEQARMAVDSPPPECSRSSDDIYGKDMDAMRCVLYLHGGGYYFGNVDQARYVAGRFARKINGRIFAINYRLAPQYPFPCALHDALAAYLFLIRPPPGSDHEPIHPAHIIIAGESAGGGLSLALLQVIRDVGLPLPAGGVLISPWCDLMHSFPSIHQNTKTDFIPDVGLSFHKPSALWPPPSSDTLVSDCSARFDFSAESTLPNSREQEKIGVKMSTGQNVEITEQLHFYTVNSLLRHPLVSPVTGYLGGLPPLLFIAGDNEVLRDEIIYVAHKAAYPEKYPALPSSRSLYPPLQDVEKRHSDPTSVHLQVYDGAPHILPILFPFATPAKFCFRAIANFEKFVTAMKLSTPLELTSESPSHHPSPLCCNLPFFVGSESGRSWAKSNRHPLRNLPDVPVASSPQNLSPVSPNGHERFLSDQVHFAGSAQLLQRHHMEFGGHPLRDGKQPIGSSGATFDGRSERTAGEPHVYEGIEDRSDWECRMIRERVSTCGIVRPLEAEDELAACKIPLDCVAQLSEASVRRYLRSREKFNQEFNRDKNRQGNIAKVQEPSISLREEIKQHTIIPPGQYLLSFPGCNRSWLLDESENPPPSSIVGRRDAEEGRKLSLIGKTRTSY